MAPESPPWYFVGRRLELAKLASALTSGELVAVALQGMGGIGKTALALQLAQSISDSFPGGILWARLGENPDTDGILLRWAETAGGSISDHAGVPVRAEALRTLLAGRGKILAVLDDVWDYGAADLLIHQALPTNAVAVLTTRDAHLAKCLGCSVEQIDVLLEDDAVALIEKLIGPLGRYETTARMVVRLVGCIPLALRISAGMADDPADLVDMVHKLRSKPALDSLALRPGDRQASVEASLKLSYDRLDEQMQRRFRALGVFAPSPFSVNAAATVWGEPSSLGDAECTHDALRFLSRRGLLTRLSENTYAQHPLLHRYALALLEREGELVATQARHANHYGLLAASGPWRTIEREFDQVREGWETIKQRGNAVYEYFQAAEGFLQQHRWSEYLEWARYCLEGLQHEGNREAEGKLLNKMGYVYWKSSQYEKAMGCLQSALVRLREMGDQDQEAICLNHIGLVYREQSCWDNALACFLRSLALHQQSGNRSQEAWTSHNVGLVFFEQGRWNDSLEHLQRSLDIFETLIASPPEGADYGDVINAREGKALVLDSLGRVHYTMQQYERAAELWQESLALAQDSGDLAREVSTLHSLGRIFITRGELATAQLYLYRSLDISRRIGHRRGEGRVLAAIAKVHLLSGEYQQALEHCQQALAIQQEMGNLRGQAGVLVRMGAVYAVQGMYEQAVSNLQEGLDIARRIRQPLTEASALQALGNVYERLNQPSAAQLTRQQAADIFLRLGITDPGA